MSHPFRTPEDYELFLDTLVERFPVISRSTLVFVRVGASMARVSGELFLVPAPEIRFDQPNIPWLVEEAGKL